MSIDNKLTRAEIKAVLIKHGYEERELPDGSVDLREYVYAAAEELLALQRGKSAGIAARMRAPEVAGAIGAGI